MKAAMEVVTRGMVLLAMAAWGAGCSSSTSDGGNGGTSGNGGALGGSGGSGGTTSPSCHAAGTLQVTASDNSAYTIDGAANPALTFCRGQTYTFALNASGHPFYIKTVQGAGTDNAYQSGVTGNGAEVGNVTFTVPADAPATLFYNCSFHPPMTGPIHIVD